jgi:hypothetical protein
LPATLGGYSTAVYSGDQANVNVTGTLTDTPVKIDYALVSPHG